MKTQFNENDKITVNNIEFVCITSYKEQPNKFLFKSVNSNFKLDIWRDDTGFWVTNPQTWIKLMNIERGSKLYSNVYGEIEFVECNHDYIFCKLDDNTYTAFTMNGRACWYNEIDECYRFDDDGDMALFPNKNVNKWFLIF